MSTLVSPSPTSVGPNAATVFVVRRRPLAGSRGLAAMLLAAAVAALVLAADRLIGAWADDHVFLGWLAVWAVIFMGTALLGGTARRLALSTLRGTASWGRAIAEARSELRHWNRIRNDQQLMAAWTQARQTDGGEPEPEAAASPAWGRFPERLSDGRGMHTHLNHL